MSWFVMGFQPFYWQRWAKIVFSEARPQTNQSSEKGKEGGTGQVGQMVGAEGSFLAVGKMWLEK